jgi:serine phosphatase RsbU (regulator of sigma subunit)
MGEVSVDEVSVDQISVDEISLDQVSVDGHQLDTVPVDHADPGRVSTPALPGETGAAARHRTAVPVYVGGVVSAAAVCLGIAAMRWHASFPLALIAFMAMATVTDLREIRLPGVGVVTLSFVPTLAALMVFGLWPALLVSVFSGGSALWLTRDPLKVLLNVGNFVMSTFLSGILYLALVGQAQGFGAKVPAGYAYAAADFLITTVVLSGVIALDSGSQPLRVWRENYQWGIVSYLTGASLGLFVAWLYLELGFAGLLLGLPPLYLIYYSYEVYVVRARERVAHGTEIAGFQQELLTSTQLHDELRAAQLKVAAEIERARRIQADLLPSSPPQVEGLEISQRIEFLGEMGGDYFDFVPYADGRLGIVCGDVMGKGLAAALIMAMARSVVHDAASSGGQPSQIFSRVNDSLARDLEGQKLPYFLTATYLLYEPASRSLTLAGAGHNPVLVLSDNGVQRLDSRGAILGVRPGLEFPEEVVQAGPGDVLAFYTDGLTEARRPDGEQFGVDRLCDLLDEHRDKPLTTMVSATWEAIDTFRAGTPPSDDATLLLVRLT